MIFHGHGQIFLIFQDPDQENSNFLDPGLKKQVS